MIPELQALISGGKLSPHEAKGAQAVIRALERIEKEKQAPPPPAAVSERIYPPREE